MLFKKFQSYITKELHLHPLNVKLLLAVSGGVDSVVLTDLFYKSGFEFIIAHCNFQLRGEESERDEAFVRLLGEKYGKEVLVKRFDTRQYASQNKLSVQAAARELRYTWFNEIMNREPLIVRTEMHDQASQVSHFTSHAIVTAHNANDNIETLLFNFFRGTGIAGLHGILPMQGKVVHPLLFAKREEIVDYAKRNELSWVEDSSNISDKYTRNFFRLLLIPALKEVFPNVEDNLLHNIERFKDVEVLYQQTINNHKTKLIEQKGNELHIPVLKLKKAQPLNSIIWEII